MNAPWKPMGTGVRDPFVAYVCDDVTAEALRPVVAAMGWGVEKIHRGGLRSGIQALSVSASPQILFVDLAESGDPLNDINALAEVCEPGTVVIAAGQVNDVRLYRDLVASGIQDYLLKPLHPDMLRDAFAHAQALFHAPRPADHAAEASRCAIAVVGARGGVGASTVASSLAWLLAEREQRSTALLDLDIHFGTGALALDLEPGRGLTDAIENPSRIDGLFIERAMVKASEKLAILSAETPINTPLVTDGSAFYQLQEEMRATFECTVIDLPRGMLVQYPQLMAEVQIAVIVTEQTLAAARDTIRLLAWMKTHAPQARVLVVANRMIAIGQPEINRKDLETSIERKVDHAIPFDQKLACQAAKLGKPLAEAGKGSRTVAPLIDLMTAVAGALETTGPGKTPARAGSLMGRIGQFRRLLAKRTAARK